ncbi:SGNH/GDSL hydrolase family protein [Lutibacter sp. HS1-25]|nr:SGNH/GDSL hydrolase family protein [Lutibacter sp. HS1-25]
MLKFGFRLIDKLAFRKVLVIGDSHAKIFNNPLFKIHFPFYAFDVCSVKGATASGLENPNSKTQAYKIFKEKLDNPQKYFKVILLLGEVDTGFVIWYRSEKYDAPISKMFNDAIIKYTNFIADTNKLLQPIVISTPLPTISDNNDWGEIANLRKTIKAKQLERTDLTIKFNNKIEKFCKTNNIEYVNLDKQSLGKNGLIDDYLLNKNSNNHHYNNNNYTKLLIRNLKKILVVKNKL